jgi:mannose-6-phosphate isomerase-like protein (cupin superfamily)
LLSITLSASESYQTVTPTAVVAVTVAGSDRRRTSAVAAPEESGVEADSTTTEPEVKVFVEGEVLVWLKAAFT